MSRISKDIKDKLRDGVEMLPERFDLPIAPERPGMIDSEADIDEALTESFPASDPPSSYHIA